MEMTMRSLDRFLNVNLAAGLVLLVTRAEIESTPVIVAGGALIIPSIGTEWYLLLNNYISKRIYNKKIA